MNIPVLPDPLDGTSRLDGKEPAAFRTIGEVANALGIRQHVLRYWEEQFPTLRPLTRAGGRRYYRPDDVALIAEIDRLLNREGYTIKGARQALRGGKPGVARGKPPETTTLAALDATVDAKIADGELAAHLLAIRNRLAAAIVD
ncbi:MAG: transcriptional regulator [Novosphingobium sp.]|nr:transcriptional regulator [Novosphingobium sp.]